MMLCIHVGYASWPWRQPVTSGAKQPGDKYYETGTQAEYVEPGLELKYVHLAKIQMTAALFREKN